MWWDLVGWFGSLFPRNFRVLPLINAIVMPALRPPATPATPAINSRTGHLSRHPGVPRAAPPAGLPGRRSALPRRRAAPAAAWARAAVAVRPAARRARPPRGPGWRSRLRLVG